ncbi:MAG TPA: ABC transporter permease, partial [Gemmatimonadaceae bacterium]|nr:ABC transporter permease [Gemmatimonadaceae bacterium]
VVRGVLLKPLPHRDGERLVYLRHAIDGPGGENIAFSVPEILDFRDGARTLGGIAEYSSMMYTLEGAGTAERIDVGLVTGNFFDVMGLSPVAGRLLNAGDDGTGVPPVAVLTHEFWMKRFGGDPAIIGQPVRLGGKPVTVVGVVQPAPYFPSRYDALLNMVMSEHHTSAMMVHGRTHRMTEMIARLAPGATVEQARREVETVAARARAEHPEAYDAGSHHRVTVTPFRQVLGQDARLTLGLLMAAAAFVLVISCANVANLTLMRGVRREQEMVVRAALGAGARRLRRLLLAENLVLALAGAAVGLLLAVGGVRLLVSFVERYSPRANEIRLDGMVLGFTLLLTLAIALLLSYAPALAKEGKMGAIAGGATRVSGSLRRQRLQRALVVAQIAVSVMLLAGAGLLTRTMQRLAQVDTGLTSERVLTMEVPFDFESRSDTDAKALFERMRSAIAALPGVEAVGVGSNVPLRASQVQLEVKAEGRALASGEAIPRAEFRTASPDYFVAAGIPLLRGRGFLATDGPDAARVVILNATLAEKLFPGRDPIGQRVAWTGDVLQFIGISGDWRTVVGVVGDTKDGGLTAEPLGVMFQPLAQEPLFGGGLAIRAAHDPAALVPTVTRVEREIVPQDPIENVKTVPQIRDESVAPRRLNAALVSSFGVLAVIIAAVGIAGVLAFSVSARAKEIGIRLSLGATGGQVQRMVLLEGGVLLGVGLLLGVGGAIVATRAIRGLLFGVEPHDPLTLVVVAVVMTAVGVGACWVPAARAARIDPAVALRRG